MSETVFGTGRTVGYSITRPANTTAYAVGQVLADSTTVASVFAIPEAAQNSRNFGIIQQLIVTGNANQATKPDLEMWLFGSAPAAENDAAAFAPSNSEILTLQTVIAIPVASWKVGKAGAGAGGNIVNDVQALGIPFNAPNLYPIIVVRNAYTPISGEVFQFLLKVLD